MDRLLFLIQSRFDQKDAIHVALSNWNFYKESVFEMVLEKNASIFVIYDEDEPINICISYHFQNVTFSSIKSYDINYSKFRYY